MLIRILFIILILIASTVGATVHIYVDTDTGNNSNNGSSWALAKANLSNALVNPVIPTTISEPYVVHCRGATPDTKATLPAKTGTSAENTITIQTDTADRHHGLWDTSKYRIEVTDDWPLYIENRYTNIYGLQIKITVDNTGSDHAVGLFQGSSGVINFAYNIIRGVISNSVDTCGIHSNTNGTNYIYNNIIYDFVNGSNANLIGMALYGPAFVYNNTFYNCYTGIRLTNNSTTDVTSVNNLFATVTQPFYGYLAALASGSDYNAATASSLGITVTGGGDTHEQLNVSATNLFNDVTGRDFRLTNLSSSQVRGAGKTDPGSGLFSDDIINVTRVVPWDIGAWKYVAPTQSGGFVGSMN